MCEEKRKQLKAAAINDQASLVAQNVNSACSAGDRSSNPGLGKSPGEGNGNPLKYSCLGNPRDRGALLQSVELQRVGHSLATKQHVASKGWYK